MDPARAMRPKPSFFEADLSDRPMDLDLFCRAEAHPLEIRVPTVFFPRPDEVGPLLADGLFEGVAATFGSTFGSIAFGSTTFGATGKSRPGDHAPVSMVGEKVGTD